VDFHTTDPYLANPFASTVDDPRELQQRVLAVMARADRRRVRIPEPGAYWEEPGHHGMGREINLRQPPRQAVFDATKRRVQVEPMRLPPLPASPRAEGMSGGTIALITIGAIGTMALAGYLWGRHKRKLELEAKGASGTAAVPPSHVGDDIDTVDDADVEMSGLELWGRDP